MNRNFHGADAASLTAVYNAFAPARYAIDADLFELNTTRAADLFDWGASVRDIDNGFVAVKRSATRRYLGPDQDTAHISLMAFTDPNLGVDMMKEVKLVLRDRGLARLVFGTDSGHFFPGCPIDFPALRDFLIVQGFEEGGECHDLERDLRDYENQRIGPTEDEFRAATAADLPAIDEFLLREFPGRWCYDVKAKLAAEGDPSTVFGLFHGERCDGFALLQWDGCRRPIGGATWRADLSERWGSLGPIGVSKELRGKGSGHALLGHALEWLRDRGTQRCIIDWTGLVDFYGAHGFEVTRTYRHMSLSLER